MDGAGQDGMGRNGMACIMAVFGGSVIARIEQPYQGTCL